MRSGRYGGPIYASSFDQGDQPGSGCVACDGPEGFAVRRDGVCLRAPDAAASEDRPLAIGVQGDFGGERGAFEARTSVDGSSLGGPLTWFPRLMRASAEQRENYRIGYSGNGLHWEDLDEDISVEALLAGRGDGIRTGLQAA